MEWRGTNIGEAWKKWWNDVRDEKLRNIPPLINWGIWLARNKRIFKDTSTAPSIIATKIVAIYSLLPTSLPTQAPQVIREEHINTWIFWSYFDGAYDT